MWDAIKSVMTGDMCMHVPVRLKSKAGGYKEAWVTREIKVPDRKTKEVWDRYKLLGSSVSQKEFCELRSIFKMEIRRGKGGRR